MIINESDGDADEGNSSHNDSGDDNLPNWPFYYSQCDTTQLSFHTLHCTYTTVNKHLKPGVSCWVNLA